jgi:hypothetical protein
MPIRVNTILQNNTPLLDFLVASGSQIFWLEKKTFAIFFNLENLYSVVVNWAGIVCLTVKICMCAFRVHVHCVTISCKNGGWN